MLFFFVLAIICGSVNAGDLVTKYSRQLTISKDTLGTVTSLANLLDVNHVAMKATGLYTDDDVIAFESNAFASFLADFGPLKIYVNACIYIYFNGAFIAPR